MNKTTVSVSGFVMLFIVLMFLPTSGWSLSDDERRAALTDNEMQWRIDNLTGPFDFRYTSRVRSAVEGYVFDYPKGAEELLGRITLFFPIFEEKLQEKNLPQEIKFLSVIESSLKVDAYSRVGAAGLWQFMQGTAKEYGLTVNKNYDQRYDVEESTDAALNYLASLYRQFDDWTLALAAYNCGPGNVRKAIRKSGGTDYWSIQKYLPRETRNYIPKFVAAYYLLEYYHEHDLIPVRPADYHYETMESEVFQHLSFEQISKITDTPLDIVKQLNPSYRKNFIPSNTRGLKLKLPRQSMYVLLQSNQIQDIRLGSENKIDYNAYIRSNFRPEVARHLLLSVNEKVEIALLPAVHYSLLENFRAISSQHLANFSIKPVSVFRRQSRSNEYLSYRLKVGETLVDVANRFPETSIESIIRINDIKLNRPPAPGTLIKIRELDKET